MEQLVVRLGSFAHDPVHWLVWSQQEQEIIASGELHSASNLDSLTERAGQRPIIALVPTSDCNLTWLTMPAKATRKALAAIPYMLEDELAGDIEQQFFATGEKVADQQAVAVINQLKMKEWLSWIEDAGLYCNKMLPDTLALPREQSHWSILQLGSKLLVRQDDWQGLEGSSEWMTDAIAYYAKQQEEPLKVDVYSELELTNLPNVEAISQPLEVPMQLLAQGAIKQKFNLLQGEFKPKRQTNNKWQEWRLVAALAGIVLLTSLVDKGVELSRLENEKQALNDQIASEYQRGFADFGSYRNLRTKVRSNITSLERGGNGKASMLIIVSELAQAFSDSKVKPQTMRYDSSRSELRIQAAAQNFEALEQFRRLAEAKGFEVQQGAINNRDDQVIGSLSIRG